MYASKSQNTGLRFFHQSICILTKTPVKLNPGLPKVLSQQPRQSNRPSQQGSTLLERDTSRLLSCSSLDLSNELQLAISIETESIRDNIWTKFHHRHPTWNAESDSKLQRELQDAYEVVRKRWMRVHQALSGSDENLKAKARHQLQECIEGRSHFNAGLADTLRQVERLLPPEAQEYFAKLKQENATPTLTEEDLQVLGTEAPADVPLPSARPNPPVAHPGRETRVSEEKDPGMSFEHFCDLLSTSYSEMSKAGQLPAASDGSFSADDSAHARRVLQWEMEKDSGLVNLLQNASGISRDDLLEEVLRTLNSVRDRKTP